jgi:hypothetical protein
VGICQRVPEYALHLGARQGEGGAGEERRGYTGRAKQTQHLTVSGPSAKEVRSSKRHQDCKADNAGNYVSASFHKLVQNYKKQS